MNQYQGIKLTDAVLNEIFPNRQFKKPIKPLTKKEKVKAVTLIKTVVGQILKDRHLSTIQRPCTVHH